MWKEACRSLDPASFFFTTVNKTRANWKAKAQNRKGDGAGDGSRGATPPGTCFPEYGTGAEFILHRPVQTISLQFLQARSVETRSIQHKQTEK